MFLAVPTEVATSELMFIADPQQLQTPLSKTLPLLVLASAILASGLAAMAAYASARKSNERILLWFGLFAATYGLELITRNPVFRLAFREPPSWWLFVESLIEFASIIPALLLWQELYGKGWRSSLTWLIRIYSVFAIQIGRAHV